MILLSITYPVSTQIYDYCSILLGASGDWLKLTARTTDIRYMMHHAELFKWWSEFKPASSSLQVCRSKSLNSLNYTSKVNLAINRYWIKPTGYILVSSLVMLEPRSTRDNRPIKYWTSDKYLGSLVRKYTKVASRSTPLSRLSILLPTSSSCPGVDMMRTPRGGFVNFSA